MTTQPPRHMPTLNAIIKSRTLIINNLHAYRHTDTQTHRHTHTHTYRHVDLHVEKSGFTRTWPHTGSQQFCHILANIRMYIIPFKNYKCNNNYSQWAV